MAAVVSLPLGSSDSQSHNAYDTDATDAMDALFAQLPLPDPGSYTKMWKIAALQLDPDMVGSVGLVDERQRVNVGQKEYNPVVSLSIDGYGCTGTIVEIDGYETIPDDATLTVTAAHCVNGADPQKITISGDYLGSDNTVHEFTLNGAEVWIHPFFGDYNIGVTEGYVDPRADIAFILSTSAAPTEVLPAKMVAEDLERFWSDANKQFGSAASAPIQQLNRSVELPHLTVAAYSGDKTGLVKHPRSKMVLFSEHTVVTTDADIIPRASGGPNFMADDQGGELALDEHGRPAVVAVVSGTPEPTPADPRPEIVKNTVLELSMVSTVPFLQKEGTGPKLCFQQAVVAVKEGTTLNRRYGPAARYERLVELDDKPSVLNSGDVVTVHADHENAEGEEWSVVTGPDGRTGYAAKAYLKSLPKLCVDF